MSSRVLAMFMTSSSCRIWFNIHSKDATELTWYALVTKEFAYTVVETARVQ